jgi:arabinogalactan oligomer / maltooligosaccharide transport system permease protein
MSNNNTSSNMHMVGFAVIGISILLVLVGFFFLPWLTYANFDKSFSGAGLVMLDIDDYLDDALRGSGEPRMTIPFTWNQATAIQTGEIPVYDLSPVRGGSDLSFVMLMLLLIVIFAGFAYLVQRRKYDYVSTIGWVAIIGVYGILFLLFFAFVSQPNRADAFRLNLAREVLIIAGTPISPDGSPYSVNDLTDIVQYGEYGSVIGTLSLGFWVCLVGMLGFVAQIFIPRDLSNTSNVVAAQGGYVTSGSVTTDKVLLVDTLVRQGVVSIAVVFALFPVVFVLSSAFNPSGQLSTQGLIPSNIESLEQLLSNFRALMIDELETAPFWNWLFNSFVVATTSTILSVLITAMSAYSFSRFRFSGRRSLLLGILLIQVFPNLLAMVALFLILRQVTLLAETIPLALPFLAGIDWSWLALFGLDSLGGVILVYMGGAMGINTWLMKGFFDSIPRDIDESALVDGATHWQIFWMLIFPLVRPILAVVGILSFVGTFNEFVLARVILRDKTNYTLMVGLFNFINNEFDRNWGKFAAGAIVATIPVVVIYIALQDQIVGGLTAGSVKG